MLRLDDCVIFLDSQRIPLSGEQRKGLKKIYPYYGAQGVIDYVDDYLFEGDHILVAEDGNNLKSRAENIATWATGRFWVNNHAHILKAKEGFDPKYIFYLLNTMDLRGFITGSAQPKLSQENLRKIILPGCIPSYPEQRKIGGTLESLDEKISNNNSIISELESMAKDLYDYWFVQFDFPDENGKPYKSSGGKMVWNEELKREIPEGWAVKQLNEMCSFSNGINYDKNEIGDKKYHIVNVRNITASSFILDNSEFDEIELKSSQADRYLINNSDILVARSGAPGAVRLLLNNDQNTIFCGFIIRCIPKDPRFRIYLSFSLKQYEGTNATTTGGSILQNVSQDTLGRVSLVVPPDFVVEAFSSFVSDILSGMQNAIEENQQLTSLRDWLLPMLMNGQVKVGKEKHNLVYEQTAPYMMAASKDELP